MKFRLKSTLNYLMVTPLDLVSMLSALNKTFPSFLGFEGHRYWVQISVLTSIQMER